MQYLSNAEVKAKSERNAEYNYKVRGDPKNGLNLHKVKKKSSKIL